MAKRVERQSPDHSAILRQNVKAQRTSMDGRGAKDANIEKFAMVRLSVVEEFLAQETIDLGTFTLSVANFNVHLQSQLLN